MTALFAGRAVKYALASRPSLRDTAGTGMPFLISRHQVQNIQLQLESVTGQPFRLRVVQNDDKTLLLAWQNETHVDYLLHIMTHDYRTFQIAFAVQRYRDIETRFDRRLELTEVRRLFDDPRQCVRHMTGQILNG
ncbi:MAG: hypothetical protein IKY83_06115 [Proteobacteria bacterium]|nr:hypothetical protein [Pseudomonadota bacterium]